MAHLYDFEANILHQTDSSYLLDCGEKKPIWFPKSLIEDNEDGTFTVEEWFAIEKEII